MSEKTMLRKYKRTCPKDSRAIGILGECFVTEILTDALDCEVLLYGGTVKAFDLLCVIYEKDEAFVFFVQVKTQYKGRYSRDRKTLAVSVNDVKLGWLIDLPIPTYIAAVDYLGDIMYIVPAFDKKVKYKSIPIKYQIKKREYDYATLLKDDVVEYWRTVSISNHKSTYKSKFV